MNDRGLPTPPILEPPTAWSDAGVGGVLLGGLALFNFLILPISRGFDGGRGSDAEVIFLVATAVGMYAAELGIMTLWLVWGPGPFLWRLAMHWTVGFALFAAWALGFAAAFGNQFGPPGGILEVWRVMLCGLPLVSLAAQLALWPFRIYFGWRIERESSPERPQPLLIRDFLAGTVVTAISLAGFRLLPEEFHRDADFGLAWGVGSLATVGISAASLLPAMFSCCDSRKPPRLQAPGLATRWGCGWRPSRSSPSCRVLARRRKPCLP
jgi:hypothetical protein